MKSFDDWCGVVLRCVRFKPDREKIASELAAHYEDHVKDLRRIGYDEDLARSRALAAMGDAEEVGQGLDKAHKPWLGWLWEWSRAAVWAVLGFMLLFVFQYELPQVQEWVAPEPYFQRMEDAVPLSCPINFTDGVYRYQFDWAEYTYDKTRDLTIIHIASTAVSDRFWLYGPELYKDLTATDSDGRTYPGEYTNGDSVEGFTNTGHYRSAVGFTIKVKSELPQWIDVTNTVAGWTFRLTLPQKGGTV